MGSTSLVGGYSAYRAHGDILLGVAVGGAVGAVTGYVGGGINTEVGSIWAQAGKGFVAKGIVGAGIGAAGGYAGGAGDAAAVLRGAVIGGLVAGAVGAAKPLLLGANVTSNPDVQQALKAAQDAGGTDLSRVTVREGGILSGLGPHDAITLGNLVNVDVGLTTDLQILVHEFAHVVQWQALGYASFATQYLAWSIKYGYINNPFEVSARDFAVYMK